MASVDPLMITPEELHATLYDADSMIEIKENIAQGFVILLKESQNQLQQQEEDAGNAASKKKKKKTKKKKDHDNNNDLAFMTLTSGNVLDACFGVAANGSVVITTKQNNNNGDNGGSPAKRSSNKAKRLIEEYNDKIHPSSTFQRTAVTSYSNAFETVIVHHKKMNKLNWFTKCFKSKKIRKQTKQNIRTAFVPLVTIIHQES